MCRIGLRGALVPHVVLIKSNDTLSFDSKEGGKESGSTLVVYLQFVERGSTMKKMILAIALCGIMSLGMAGCGQADSGKFGSGEANDSPQSQNEYGSVEKENVETLVAKFNTEVMDNSSPNDGSPNDGSLNPAMDEYLTEVNNQYWYGLVEGIFLVAVPEEYTGDKAADIVDYMIIHADKSGEYESDAVSYAKNLIKANRNDVTESEIVTLLEEAKDKASTGKMAFNGNGISVGYLDEDGIYQYQVRRFFE